jgi:hypothetical protein
MMHSPPHHSASPLVDWGAISSGALIGLALSLVAGALWTAAAFSSHNSAFYDDLAWWYGGTLVGGVLIGAAGAGALSTTRGAVAGAANGLTVGAFTLVATGAVGIVVAIANGTTATVASGALTLHVALVRPYVVFWASLVALAAGALGGAAGGLAPRREATMATTVSGIGRPTGLEAAGTRRPSEAVAG